MAETTTYSELSGIKQKRISGTQINFRFAPAFFVFILICQLASRSNIVKVDPLAGPRRTWTTWALDSFVHSKQAPDVVFLGSSLMLTPLNTADAQALHTTFDGALHHESNWFSALLKYSTGRDVQTFNFAVPGEMPSDAFLIGKNLFKAEKKPKLVVYGVGPRDFMDSLLASPSATDPYHWLAKLDPQPSEWEFCGNSWSQKVNCALSNIFLPNVIREQLAEDLGYGCTKLVDLYLPAPLGGKALSPRQMHQMLPGYHAMDVALGEGMFRPRVDVYAGRFKSNLDEYRERYAHPDWEKFQTQINFLSRLLALGNERQIKFVLVAMPITKINRNLISEAAWKAYKNGLTATAKSTNAELLDLSDDKSFTDFDFGDTVHLNALGGLKMIKKVADTVVTNPRLSAALGVKSNQSTFATKGVTLL